MNWKEFIGSDGEVEHVIPLNKVAHLVAVKYQERRLSVLGLVDEDTKKPFKIIDYCQPDIDSEKQMIKKYWRLTHDRNRNVPDVPTDSGRNITDEASESQNGKILRRETAGRSQTSIRGRAEEVRS